MNKLEYVARSLSKGTNKPAETYVINAIYQKVNNPELIIETQKNVAVNDKRYMLDMYLPQLQIAIEVDESYHETDEQKIKDKEREFNTKQHLSNEFLGNKIEFKRVPANIYTMSLEEINKEIDIVVDYIKAKIATRFNFVWEEKNVIEECKKRGYIALGDCFYTNCEIINLAYNKQYKGWQKAGYDKLWFPIISVRDNKTGNETSCHSWINYIDTKCGIIYEKSNNPTLQEWKQQEAKKHLETNDIRYAFVKDKDEFGKPQKRFAGIYRADGWDEIQQAERWRQIASELQIPVKERIILKNNL